MKNITLLSRKFRTVRLLVSIVVIFASIVSVSSCSKSESIEPTPDPTTPPTTGTGTTTNTGFSLQSTDDKTVKLSDFNNKVLVIFFFGNACPTCKAVGPSIQSKLNTPFASNSNFAIIGIDQWDGNKASVLSFKNLTGITFPLLLEGSDVAQSYSTTYDRLLVIDKDGEVVFNGNNNAANDIDAVVQKINDIL